MALTTKPHLPTGDLVDQKFYRDKRDQLWDADIDRHDALLNREEVRDLLLWLAEQAGAG